jgi:hypothetical protein
MVWTHLLPKEALYLCLQIARMVSWRLRILSRLAMSLQILQSEAILVETPLASIRSLS